MIPSTHRFPASLLALVLASTVLGGCTLALPMATSVGETSRVRIEQTLRYTVAQPPRDGASVLVILDDGSEVAGAWRGHSPGERVLVETRTGLETVDVARIVQIRPDATRRASRAGGATAVGLLIDGIIALRILSLI